MQNEERLVPRAGDFLEFIPDLCGTHGQLTWAFPAFYLIRLYCTVDFKEIDCTIWSGQSKRAVLIPASTALRSGSGLL